MELRINGITESRNYGYRGYSTFHTFSTFSTFYTFSTFHTHTDTNPRR